MMLLNVELTFMDVAKDFVMQLIQGSNAHSAISVVIDFTVRSFENLKGRLSTTSTTTKSMAKRVKVKTASMTPIIHLTCDDEELTFFIDSKTNDLNGFIAEQ